MNPSTAFALHFARLLSQLIHEPTNTEGHRHTVDDLLESNQEPVALVWDNWQLMVAGAAIPASMPGVRDVVARMAAHGIREISFGKATEPGHVLGAVWILARDPVVGDGGASAVERLRNLGASRVQFVPVNAPPRSAAPSPQTASAPDDEIAGRSTNPGLLLDDFELDLDFTERTNRSMEAPIPVAPQRTTPPPVAPSTDEAPETIIAGLQSATTVGHLAAMVDALAAITEKLVGAQKIPDAATIVFELIDRLPRFSSHDAKRAFRVALKRVGETTFLRELAADLPRSRDRREQYLSIYAWYGDDAVDALIEQLVYAEQARDRRILFDAIVQLRRGHRTLIAMLADDRWYAVRNAADLLGRLGATEAEAALIRVLRHDEPRVRRSAAAALAKLGTQGAFKALREAMGDPSPGVRLHALLAVGNRKEPEIVASVFQALDAEQDPEVQRAIFTTLGKIATPDAIRRLIDSAADDGRLFRRKPAPFRVAAIRALAEVQTPEAVAALKSLTEDRDREVRDSAAKGLAARGSSGLTQTKEW